MKASAGLLCVVALLGPSAARADGPLTPGRLARMSPEQLDALFAAGTADRAPLGPGRGRVLVRVTGKLPRLRARLNGVAWKGKVFRPDGTYINQWAGFRAVEGAYSIGPSWYDGRPCVAVEHEPGTKVFGNARDELREVAPGVWLGRFYEVRPCGRWQGYFVLEMRGQPG